MGNADCYGRPRSSGGSGIPDAMPTSRDEPCAAWPILFVQFGLEGKH